MNKTPVAQRDGSLRAEKDIRLRIDLLEGQSSSIAKMLAKAIRDRNEAAFKEYAERLAANRGRVEELLWVLGEKAGQSVLDLQVAGKDNSLSVKEAIEKLRAGELKMDDLSAEAQAMVRKGALEMKNARKG
jgi:stress response protein YsnF